MTETVICSDEFEAQTALVLLLSDGRIVSRCRRASGLIQQISHSDAEQARRFVAWWLRRPE
jgi:hypothetical protein